MSGGGEALERALAPFRAVAPLLRDWLPARALALALENGVAEALVAARDGGGPRRRDALARAARLPRRGLDLLLDLLGEGAVAPLGEEEVEAAPALRAAWPHRDLLRAKLDYAALALPDLHHRLGALLGDMGRFQAESDIFRLFRYDLALGADAAALEATRRWVAITTALSRHEAPVLAALRDGWGAALLDLGGNSGETARALCAAHPALRATVADLPAVCALGRAHLAGAAEAGRVYFLPVDLRAGAPPAGGGFDTVLLKSVLHDWPAREAERLLRLARDAARPGGSVVVFERAPLTRANGFAPGYGAGPDLLFHAFYRGPEETAAMARRAGLLPRPARVVALDAPFVFLEAERPLSAG